MLPWRHTVSMVVSRDPRAVPAVPGLSTAPLGLRRTLLLGFKSLACGPQKFAPTFYTQKLARSHVPRQRFTTAQLQCQALPPRRSSARGTAAKLQTMLRVGLLPPPRSLPRTWPRALEPHSILEFWTAGTQGFLGLGDKGEE